MRDGTQCGPSDCRDGCSTLEAVAAPSPPSSNSSSLLRCRVCLQHDEWLDDPRFVRKCHGPRNLLPLSRDTRRLVQHSLRHFDCPNSGQRLQLALDIFGGIDWFKWEFACLSSIVYEHVTMQVICLRYQRDDLHLRLSRDQYLSEREDLNTDTPSVKVWLSTIHKGQDTYAGIKPLKTVPHHEQLWEISNGCEEVNMKRRPRGVCRGCRHPYGPCSPKLLNCLLHLFFT